MRESVASASAATAPAFNVSPLRRRASPTRSKISRTTGSLAPAGRRRGRAGGTPRRPRRPAPLPSSPPPNKLSNPAPCLARRIPPERAPRRPLARRTMRTGLSWPAWPAAPPADESAPENGSPGWLRRPLGHVDERDVDSGQVGCLRRNRPGLHGVGRGARVITQADADVHSVEERVGQRVERGSRSSVGDAWRCVANDGSISAQDPPATTGPVVVPRFLERRLEARDLGLWRAARASFRLPARILPVGLFRRPASAAAATRPSRLGLRRLRALGEDGRDKIRTRLSGGSPWTNRAMPCVRERRRAPAATRSTELPAREACHGVHAGSRRRAPPHLVRMNSIRRVLFRAPRHGARARRGRGRAFGPATGATRR